jgi:hypothetical protein
MPRVTISLRAETAKDLSALAESLGCSRSALVDIILAKGLLKHLTARMDYLNMSRTQHGPVKRLRGESIREIEETIHYLETNYQGELWDAAD